MEHLFDVSCFDIKPNDWWFTQVHHFQNYFWLGVFCATGSFSLPTIVIWDFLSYKV